jgi:formylglycine-generating enzyme required for sulfatase activity
MERTFALFLLLSACDPGTEVCGDGLDNDHDALVDCQDDDCSAEPACTDLDGDGFMADLDCDDHDASSHPDGTEVCDGADNDCDGEVDEDAVDPATWYVDTDGDGYGNGGFDTEACEAPAGYVADGTDCDDADGSVYPGADEWCDGVDHDCDGDVFEDDSVDAPTWHIDYDGDGYGEASVYDVEACEQPEGYVADATDCDDTDPTAHPAGTEVCDGVDQDCDGVVDEGTTCYDDDGDGQTEEEGDCDDADPAVYSGAVSDHEGIAMAYICPGTFTMGSPEDEVGRESDETQREVTLTRGFWIGVTEVTQESLFDLLGFTTLDADTSARCADTADEWNCPAGNINWHEAASLANAVSTEAGLELCYYCEGSRPDIVCELDEDYTSPYDCEGYRLPTEAEWEYAARAGTTSAFPNGGNLVAGTEDDCSRPVVLDNGAVLGDIAWYCGNSGGVPHAVAQLDPSPWGLYDVIGNIVEWVHDGYGAYPEGPATDPIGPESGDLRNDRGSAYYHGPASRVASRWTTDPTSWGSGLGLRLARTIPEDE